MCIQKPIHFRVNLQQGEETHLLVEAGEISVMRGGGYVSTNAEKWSLTQGDCKTFDKVRNGITLVAPKDGVFMVMLTVDAQSTVGQQMKQQSYARMMLHQQIIEAEYNLIDSPPQEPQKHSTRILSRLSIGPLRLRVLRRKWAF